MKLTLMFLARAAICFLIAAGRASSDDGGLERVRPILSRCVACHNPDDASGDLDLTTKEAALRGGESGPALIPGDPEGSRMLRQIVARKMPPKHPLSDEETGIVREWLKSGAPWSGKLDVSVDNSPRWAFQPIVSTPPPVARDDAWSGDPIDAEIIKALREKGLRPNPPAERRDWLRRATFDLLGLPPTPREVADFESDARPDAFERAADRLLASPRYGERWARHWLDVARFAESHGFEYDRLRENAWRYRDYVVQSLNADKPYAQFIREQIAGDSFTPATSDGIVATGFLVAGPWDQAGSGQANVIGRGKVRDDELEDMVGLVGQTFLGLTVQCARCHDHKFDPIPQRDFYRLKAVFEGVGHEDRPALGTVEKFQRDLRLATLERTTRDARARVAKLEREARVKVLSRRSSKPVQDRPKPLGLWTFETSASDDAGGIPGRLEGGAAIVNGRLVLAGKAHLRTPTIPADLSARTLEAWVSLTGLEQRGGAVVSLDDPKRGRFDAIVFGELEPGRWAAGSDFLRRSKKGLGDVETAKPGEMIHLAVAHHPDGRIQLFRNGRPYGAAYKPTGAGSELQTYARSESRLLFGLRHEGAGNGHLSGEIEEVRIYDRALSDKEIGRSFELGPIRVSLMEIDESLDPRARRERVDLIRHLEEARLEADRLRKAPLVYAARSFNPPPTKVLARGEFVEPKDSTGETVAAGGLSAVRHPRSEFGLRPDSPESERRIKQADWIADPKNPLTSRVIVNRVWHYHFGNGLVATPSDFGANGQRPTHPALLDRLASDFVADGGRLKPLHRRMVLSSAYRQSSRFNPGSADVDPESRLLWRFPPRRIEGEAVIDAMRAVSGSLSSVMGGPSFRPFTVTEFNSSFYNLTDPDGLDYRRRMIYRMHVHSARSPLMEALDCPDPSVKTARRASTVTPLQALALMNDSFVERQARRFAERLETEAGKDHRLQLELAYRLALGRSPRADEVEAALDLIREHSPSRLAWALLNSNEFLYLR